MVAVLVVVVLLVVVVGKKKLPKPLVTPQHYQHHKCYHQQYNLRKLLLIKTATIKKFDLTKITNTRPPVLP